MTLGSGLFLSWMWKRRGDALGSPEAEHGRDGAPRFEARGCLLDTRRAAVSCGGQDGGHFRLSLMAGQCCRASVEPCLELKQPLDTLSTNECVAESQEDSTYGHWNLNFL